jgi:acyl-CoA thioester hydrolase
LDQDVRHTTHCPLRWADMDMLKHINNVSYVDYLQEARIDMFSAHPEFRGGEDLGEGVVVVGHQLEFVAPLSFRGRPVSIDSWITEIRAASFTMAYEVYDDAPADEGSGRTVYLRASSVLAPYVFASERPRRISDLEREVLGRYFEPADERRALPDAGSNRHVYPLRVRWSDVDAYRHVNNVKYIEYFQEARIRYQMQMHQPGDVFGSIVIARMDVDYRRPIMFRREPYDVRSWVSDVGRRSFVVAAEIRDSLSGPGEGERLASCRVVAVGFDPDAQRSVEFTADHRTRLLEELRAG